MTVTLPALAFLFLSQAAPMATDIPHLGWLRGRVVSRISDRDSVIIGFQVEVASGGTKCDVTSDGGGEFNCKLPKGRYRVTAPGGNGCLPYRTSTIDIPADGHRFLIVRPVVSVVAGTGDVIPSGPEAVVVYTGPKDPVFQYEEHALPGGGGSDVLIRYESLQREDRSTVFRSKHLMLSVETLAIHAEEMRCATDWSICTASGSVLVDLENETFTGKSLELNLKNRWFTLTREAQVGRTF
jgi:hypothetical protein